MLSVQTADILGQSPFPGYRHRQEQRIEPRIVKPFANIPARRQYEAFLGL